MHMIPAWCWFMSEWLKRVGLELFLLGCKFAQTWEQLQRIAQFVPGPSIGYNDKICPSQWSKREKFHRKACGELISEADGALQVYCSKMRLEKQRLERKLE